MKPFRHCFLHSGILLAMMVAMSAQTVFAAREPVAPYVSHQTAGNTVLFNCQGTHKVKLTVCGPRIVRVEFDPKGAFTLPAFGATESGWTDQKVDLATYVMKNNWPAQNFTATDATDHIKIATSAMTVRVYKSPFRVQFWNADNTVCINKDADDAGMECNTGGSGAPCDLYVKKSKLASEHFFGFAEQYGTVKDYAGTSMGDDNGYDSKYTAPFFYSTAGYGIFGVFDGSYNSGWQMQSRNTNSASSWDMGQTSASAWSFRWYSKNVAYYKQYLIYYFIYGPGWSDVIDGYTQISGRPTVIRKCYYGVHINNFPGNYGGTPLMSTWETFATQCRNGKFPVDVMYADDNTNWGADVPEPGVSGQTYRWFPTGGAYYNGSINQSDTAFLRWFHSRGMKFSGNESDRFCNPEDAQAVQTAVDRGFDVYWRDMTACGKSHRDAKNSFDNFLKAHHGDTTQVFIRHGWHTWAAQAYGPYHSGDGNNTSQDFGAQLAPTTVGYSTSMYDNGIDVTCLPYLSVAPVVFFHPYGGSGDVRPWTLSTERQTAYRQWIGFHYRMIPYLFTYGSKASEKGMPVWRHMVTADPSNAATYGRHDQAYVGDWLIVAKNTSLWVPKGTWYGFLTGRKFQGETPVTWNTAESPLALIAREGAIVPMMPLMQYVGEIPEDPLTLRIFPLQSGTSSFELCEDETRVKTVFTCTGTSNGTAVQIPPFAGSRYSSGSRKYELEVFTAAAPAAVYLNAKTNVIAALGTKAAYDGQTAGWYWEALGSGGICHIKPAGNAAQGFTVYVGDVISTSAGAAPARDQKTFASAKLMNGRQLSINVSAPGPYSIEILDAAGRCLTSLKGTGAASYIVPVDGFARGVLLTRISSPGFRVILRTPGASAGR